MMKKPIQIKVKALVMAFLVSASSLMAQDLNVQFLGRYSSGIFDEGASEIVDYYAPTQTIFSTNSDANTVDAVSISDPANPVLSFSIDLSPYGGGVNSVKVLNTGIVVAVEANIKQDLGAVVFFDFNGNYINQVTVGALPDMVTSTSDFTKLIVANEGEPDDNYLVDPMGSVSIIDISGGLASVSAANVTTLDFTGFTEADIPGVRVFGLNASLAQDMEPEYVAVSADNTMAWVVCQENNVIAAIDLTTDSWGTISALGTIDHSLTENAIDASNRDDAINITTWPVKGYFLPDAIDAYEVNGADYVVLANEGDSRDYDGYSEEARVKDLTLDPTAFPNAATLQEDEQLGRLKITLTAGDTDNDGDFDELYSYGSRSFSIRDANGNLVFDSGSDFETITAQKLGNNFNSTNDENDSFDNRSDDKGPEPEAVEIAEIDGRFFAFIGLERVGGIMVYDITDPQNSEYVTYINTRDFSGDLQANGTDSGVENITFIDASDSPTGEHMIAASNEVSGTISLFSVVLPDYTLQLLHASDLEGGVDAISRAKDFAAIVDILEHETDNTLILSAGDNYIPGPFYNASADFSMRSVFQDVYQDLFNEAGLTNIREGAGKADITIMNIIGFDASAVGNHEFDATPDAFESVIEEDIRGAALNQVRWLGAEFPYLSANLDFSNDGDLSNLFTSDILPHTDFQSQTPLFDNNRKKIAPATTIMKGGEMIGVVGATTQLLESITSNGDVSVIGGPGNDMAALAATIQPVIDQLEGMGIDKIILVSHLQQIQLEQQLVGLLSGVDIIIAGGSDSILADSNDRLDADDTADFTYPLVSNNADGNPALIVSTDGEYNYVGRLVVGFDESGNVMLNTLDESINGPYIADAQMVSDLYGSNDPFVENSKGELVSRLVSAVEDVVIAKDGTVFGKTSVYLDGRKSQVRSQETNMGNLTADANLFIAQSYDPTVQVSLKNGGGIRAAIGEVVEVSPGVFEFLPPQANPLTGKEEMEVSQLDIENTLRFNNGLTLFDLSAADLKEVVEHGLAAAAPGATPGSFTQVGGMRVVYDNTAPAGSRISTLEILDNNGQVQDLIVSNGQVSGDADRVIRIVTLDFLAGGGDGYPYPQLGENRVDLEDVMPTGGAATFADAGSEQDALAEYLASEFSVTPFDQAETTADDDNRIIVAAAAGTCQSFEDGFGAWINSTNDDFDWTINSGLTPSYNTGPNGAADGNNYAYMEVSYPNNPAKDAMLISPRYFIESSSSVTFNYHMKGNFNSVGTLNLDISTDGGSSWTTEWSRTSSQGNNWNDADIDLSAYAGELVSFRLHGTSAYSYIGDIAVDNFCLEVNIQGCTDPEALNYDPAAVIDDGSCSVFTCNAVVSNFPACMSFENGLGDWGQSSDDDIDWTLRNSRTPSWGTGPDEANDGDYFIYIEASFPNYPSKSAILNAACYDFSGLMNPAISFDYHMRGAYVGTLGVQASVDGMNWDYVWMASGQQGLDWLSTEISLADYAGQTVQIRFVGETANGWQGDIGIDNVCLSNATYNALAPLDDSKVKEQMASTKKALETAELQEDEFSAAQLLIYPNPVNANTEVTIELSSDLLELETARVNIYDMAGRVVYSSQEVVMSGNQFTLFADFPVGVYQVNIESNDMRATQKLIIK